MRRYITNILLFALCILLLTGCGKKRCAADGCRKPSVEDEIYEKTYCEVHLSERKAYKIAEKAYENFDNAYLLMEIFSADLCEAGLVGTENEKILDNSLSLLGKNLHLSKEDLYHGILYEGVGTNWNAISYSDKAAWEKDIDGTSDGMFVLWSALGEIGSGDMFSHCIGAVRYGYELIGCTELVEEALNAADESVEHIGEVYPDYTYYPQLEELNSLLSSFFDLCNKTPDTYDELRIEVNDYNDEVSELLDDLRSVFGEREETAEETADENELEVMDIVNMLL